MNIRIPLSLRLDFERSAEARREDERDRQFKADEDRQREKRKEERRKREQLEKLVTLMLATSAQIAEFTAKLDLYDTASVDALMANERDMESVRESLKRMYEEAYVLPDGRRVFKTEDGSRVFDEHGVEMNSSAIEPAQIDDRLPRWEDVVAQRAERDRLQTERTQLHAYQDKLDAARERLSDDELTAGELEDLERSLDEAMPERIRQQLGKEAPKAELDQQDEIAPARKAFRPGVQRGMPSL